MTITNKPKGVIAILGFNRSFAEEHRIRNEIEVFSPEYLIDGYGSKACEGLVCFYSIHRPTFLLRRVVIFIGIFFPILRIWFQTFFYRRYLNQIKAKNYRFIIVHNIDEALLALKTGIPFLFHSHEYLPRQFDGSILFRITESRFRHQALQVILPKAVLIIVEGQTVAHQYAFTYGVPEERFIVMPSMPQYRAFFNNSPPVCSTIKLIHHGMLVPERGIDLLIDIIDALGPRYHLTLMGPGPAYYVQSLEIRAKKVGNISILAPVPYERIVESIHNYDLGLIIFGSPHFHHKYMTVPNKFWECLQARIPVLVSSKSAMAEYVLKSGCGIVSKSASLESYIDAIRCLTNQDIAAMKMLCEERAWIHSRDSWLSTYAENVERAVVVEYENRMKLESK